MPPISPYVPNTPQNSTPQPSQLGQTGFSLTPPTSSLPPHPSQAPSFSHQMAPVQPTGSVDCDWIIRFGYFVVLSPQILTLVFHIYLSVSHLTLSYLKSMTIGVYPLYAGAQIVVELVLYWILVFFAKGAGNYKRILVAMLLATWIAYFVNSQVVFKIVYKELLQQQVNTQR